MVIDFLIIILSNYSRKALGDKGGVSNGLLNKHIQRSYNQILRQIRIIFSKQIQIFDFHSTLLESEREDFVKDVCLLKFFIENEKCKVNKGTNGTVPPNSDENNDSEYSDSDESCWCDEDDVLLFSDECSHVQEMEKVEKVLVDKNTEDVGENLVEKEVCTGIGKKDF